MNTPQVKPQLKELLLQSLEHERGGVEIYEAALKCAVHEDLSEEWDQYLHAGRLAGAARGAFLRVDGER